MAEFTIRSYHDDDLDQLKAITVEAFDGVSIDRNIEDRFGPINGRDWRSRKAKHIQADADRDPSGIFVAECDGQIVGYITTFCDPEHGMGNIPNLAIDADFRGKGLGKLLIQTALDHFRSQGMSHARIETLAQNQIGQTLYPAIGFEEVARQVHFCMDLHKKS